MSITLESFGESNLQQIEYLLAQSVKGLHLLFDSQTIKQAYTQPRNGIMDFDQEDREKVQNLFSGLIQNTSLDAKKDYLSQLSDEDQEVLIKAYFHIVENTIKNSLKISH
jgi:hypothetical protein